MGGLRPAFGDRCPSPQEMGQISSPSREINELIALHAAGRFAEMETRARVVLAAWPGAAVVSELLGIALSAQQRHREALEPLQRAVNVKPDDAQFWENLALCQYQVGELVPAEASLRQSLVLRPGAAPT